MDISKNKSPKFYLDTKAQEFSRARLKDVKWKVIANKEKVNRKNK